jgi:hypothetical protein
MSAIPPAPAVARSVIRSEGMLSATDRISQRCWCLADGRVASGHIPPQVGSNAPASVEGAFSCRMPTMVSSLALVTVDNTFLHGGCKAMGCTPLRSGVYSAG